MKNLRFAFIASPLGAGCLLGGTGAALAGRAALGADDDGVEGLEGVGLGEGWGDSPNVLSGRGATSGGGAFFLGGPGAGLACDDEFFFFFFFFELMTPKSEKKPRK